ncbi:MAG: transglutaminase-like domain-containing protein [Bacteroidales bacterium]
MKICIWTLLTLGIFCAESFSQQTDSVYLTDDERTERLMLDFSKTRKDILNELSVYGLHTDSLMIEKWEYDRKLECRTINGVKYYFKNAVSNLFRLDSYARKIMRGIDSLSTEDVWVRVPRETAIRIVNQKNAEGALFAPQEFEVSFNISVPFDSLTDKDTIIKCWLPAPQLNVPRQQHVIIASPSLTFDVQKQRQSDHASIYMEKQKGKLGEPLVFEASYSFKSYAQHYSLDYLFKHERKQDLTSDLYKRYTSQRDNHIIFTSRVRELGDSLRNSRSDVQTIKNIFDYISANIPWCSALEYCNIDNIPMYVLQNGHGDCGQVSLLFITLCRYCGIPAKWQSGWMLHPGAVNLHDWSEVYIEGVGWIPVDVSFGKIADPDSNVAYFYLGGIDPYRFVVNEDFSSVFSPEKLFFRSEPVDFQRGEVETNQRNLYFNKWKYKMNIKNIPL